MLVAAVRLFMENPWPGAKLIVPFELKYIPVSAGVSAELPSPYNRASVPVGVAVLLLSGSSLKAKVTGSEAAALLL